jgi:inositol transporter-like SP family MFS transporter
MFFLLAPWEIMGARIVFTHLLLLALLLTLLRSNMRESDVWTAAKLSEQTKASDRGVEWVRLRVLLEPQYLKSILFLVGMYGIWNLWAGTVGFFFPYILRTIGGQTQAAAMALSLATMPIFFASLILVFMRYSDRVSQRLLFGIASACQIVAMALPAVLPITAPVVILYLVLSSIGAGFGAQCFYQLWSVELFPTLVRGTAQGLTFAGVRIGLGLWSFFVPSIAASQFTTLAWTLTGFLVVSGAIGVIWAPRNEGKSLAQIELERKAAAPPPRRSSQLDPVVLHPDSRHER